MQNYIKPKADLAICDAARDTSIPARASLVWNLISRDCSIIEWHDRIESCEAAADPGGRLKRVMVLKSRAGRDPIRMVETELLRSPEIMTISYVVEIEGLPIENYHAQIMVADEDGGCHLVQRSRFTAPRDLATDMRSLVEDFYRVGQEGIAEMMRRAG